MHFEPIDRWAGSVKLQQTCFYVWRQVDADGAHIPKDLAGRFFERKEQTVFAALASRMHKGASQAGLAGASHPGNQDRAAAVKALASQHLVQLPNSTGDPTGGHLMLKLQ